MLFALKGDKDSRILRPGLLGHMFQRKDCHGEEKKTTEKERRWRDTVPEPCDCV